ncbi:TPA: hypothetical protein IHN84_004891, partial [Escherichia coli]|nr:hypothetical protein [Escherichia coli]
QQKGNYVRSGNIITATCHLGITLIGSGDGFRIGGLPYVSSNKAAYVGSTGYYNNLTTAVTALLPRVDANSSYITLTGATTLSGNMNIYQNVLGNNAEVIITVTYEID